MSTTESVPAGESASADEPADEPASAARPLPRRPLDRQQARLIELLLDADGPLSFEDLHERGIVRPAMLAYELELTGFPVHQVQRLRARHAPVPVGLELDRSWLEPEVGESVEPEPWPRDRSAVEFVRRRLVAGGEAVGTEFRRIGPAIARLRSVPGGKLRDR